MILTNVYVNCLLHSAILRETLETTRTYTAETLEVTGTPAEGHDQGSSDAWGPSEPEVTQARLYWL